MSVGSHSYVMTMERTVNYGGNENMRCVEYLKWYEMEINVYIKPLVLSKLNPFAAKFSSNFLSLSFQKMSEE